MTADHHPVPAPRVSADLWFRSIYQTPLLLAGIADLDGVVLDANRLSVEGVGYDRGDVVGRPFWHGPWWRREVRVQERVRALCAAARAGAPQRVESEWWAPDGSTRHVDLAIHPVPDADGTVSHLFLSGLDITDRVLTGRELAASLQLSEHILATVADGIYGLDVHRGCTFANESAVRMLGYSMQQLAGRDLHALLHREPDGSPAPPERCPAARALRLGTTVASAQETFCRADGTLIPVELSAVPTVTDGEVTGVVVSFRDITAQLAAARHAEQMHELARREAASRALADRLQQVLLTSPRSAPGLEVRARYRPAAADAKVGGDWHDAFAQADGSMMLVIGDVVGHDSSAAGAMAQLRGLLRGVAYGDTGSPAAVLERFDVAVRGLSLAALATVLLARVEILPAPDGGRGRLRFTWSNAGHLPPVVLSAGGRMRVLETRPDLLIGVDPQRRRAAHEVDLDPDSTVLLYTDGLVERRDSHIDAGLAALGEALADLGRTSLDTLCDTALERMLPQAVDDDVVVLALRSEGSRPVPSVG